MKAHANRGVPNGYFVLNSCTYGNALFIRGFLVAIGIRKDKPFAPDELASLLMVVSNACG